MTERSSATLLPEALYVWLVPSEHVQEQPGSWRIRKWDTEPFPEANFRMPSAELSPAFAARCRPAVKTYLTRAEQAVLKIGKQYPEHYRNVLERDASEARKLLDEIEAAIDGRSSVVASTVEATDGPYSYEYIHEPRSGRPEGGHYRVRDKGDNRIATCYLEENAKTIVAALNASSPPSSIEAFEEYDGWRELEELVQACRDLHVHGATEKVIGGIVAALSAYDNVVPQAGTASPVSDSQAAGTTPQSAMPESDK